MRGPLIVLAVLCPLANPARALAEGPGIHGRWSPMDGSAVINVAPCSVQAARLCGVVEQENLAPGEQSLLGKVVVGDLAPAGPGRWRGRYFEGGASFGATVKVISSNLIDFSVCVAPLLCQTERYQRAGD